VKDALVSILDDGGGVICAMITENLAGGPEWVASAMSDESTNFWREISNWMMTYYDEQKTCNNDSTKECWALVIYCLKAIFCIIQKARVLGTTRNPESMVWASLQAHKVCRELMSLKFRGHPDVSVILHQHLIDNSVHLSCFDALQLEFKALCKSIKEVHEEAAAARSLADRALGTAQGKKKT